MNASDTHPVGVGFLLKSIYGHRELLRQLTWQEIVGRYRGSVIGLSWSFLAPLLMLAVYTFVFSVVFGARWNLPQSQPQDNAQFAVILFAGLAVFNIFADCVNRAPGMIVANTNYVKRVVFPLELLPIIALGNALFHFSASMLVWLVVTVVMLGGIPWTAVLLPIVLFPLALATLGVTWFLASLGVYLRDVSQITSIVVTGLLFLSPIFFPAEAVPPQYRAVVLLNPLGYIVESARRVLIFGELPHGPGLLIAMAAGSAIAWVGFWWFQKTRKGFADVL
ncbi:ABC transporter permease [Cognatilysobacter tabacisoli]|uniref:ABC transporter permease n=1 Tax=Cognatilysobacter tabacisoli TaxID=2315424 RepID=UPI000E6B08A4|nr:ABC transporter permease [Lysobacter tabacisoli]